MSMEPPRPVDRLESNGKATDSTVSDGEDVEENLPPMQSLSVQQTDNTRDDARDGSIETKSTGDQTKSDENDFFQRAEEDDEGDEKEEDDDNESVSSKESDSEDGARSRLAHSDETVSPMTSEKRRVDRWGLVVEETRASDDTATIRAHAAQLKIDSRREDKWIKMIQKNISEYRRKYPKKFKERVRKGIPDSVRSLVWSEICGAVSEKKKHPGVYQSLMNKRSPYESTILHDIDRTYPLHVLYRSDAIASAKHRRGAVGGQEALLNVCRAYSLHDKEMGYTQGVGFPTGIFLMYMNEEDAFWTLERVSRGPMYNLAGLYSDGFPLLKEFFFVLENLMRKHVPKLLQHFQAMDPPFETQLFATQWFFSIFAYDFPMELVLRIYDVFLNEGVKFVFRVALYILKKLERELMALEFGEAFQLLKHVSQHKLLRDTNKFIRGALRINLRRSEISDLRAKYQSGRPQSAPPSSASPAPVPLGANGNKHGRSKRVEDSPSSNLNSKSYSSSPVKEASNASPTTPLATPRA